MFIVGGLISWPHSIITGHTKLVWFVSGSSYYHFVCVKQNPVITSLLELLMICSGYERECLGTEVNYMLEQQR